MIWRTENGRSRKCRALICQPVICQQGTSQSGFTLIEMIVVLVVLGLVLGLVMARGPLRSPALEAGAAAREVAQALRLGRSRAIALDRPVSVSLDVVAHDVRIDGGPVQALPRGVDISVASLTGEALAGRVVVLSFAPDGSASGARIDLREQGFRRGVAVDWLTGRVRVDAPR
jgi:general secretion pathway protein H